MGNILGFFYSNKSKEQILKEFLEKNFDLVSHNRCIKNNGSKKRPDFVITLRPPTIIVECDENAHRYYGDRNEIERMKSIYEDNLRNPIVFIRYNPDNYIDNKGEKQNMKLKYRHKILDKLIKDIRSKNIVDYELAAYYLFYDGYDKESILPRIIIPANNKFNIESDYVIV